MRTHADAPELFRLRVTRSRTDGTTREEVRGPWALAATARGQRTAILTSHGHGERQAASMGYSPVPAPVVVIERCAPEWEAVA